MVPIFGIVITGRLIGRFGPGPVIAAGASIYGVGVAWWALRAGIHPNYLGQVLPGTLCTGVGVGLTLPTFMASGTSSLPPQSFATGSAVVNMLRQVGLAIGVSVFVAVLGTPNSPAASVSAFRHGWEVIAAISFAAAGVGLFALSARRAAVVEAGERRRRRANAGGRPRRARCSEPTNTEQMKPGGRVRHNVERVTGIGATDTGSAGSQESGNRTSRALELEFRHVEKRYPGARQAAIPDLSLTVPAGEVCVLVGPSGSGKTTAMRLINRMIALTGGDILLGGHSVLERDPTELRRERSAT